MTKAESDTETESRSAFFCGERIGEIGKIPGILRVYLQKPGYTRVIPALLHGFASWDHTLSRYTLITTPHTTFAYHYTTPLQIARRR